MFPAEGRRRLAILLFAEKESGSASRLARLAGVSPRTALLVLHELETARLVECEGVGAALLFRAAANPVTDALRTLLKASLPQPRTAEALEAAVTHFGAPLLRRAGAETRSLEETLAEGAKSSRKDPTLFRTLPVVVMKHWRALDWDRLQDSALRMNARREVGLVLDLTGTVAALSELSERARERFRDHRRKSFEYFFEPRNEYERKLAEARTPPVVKRWKFHMNIDLLSLRSTVEKHV